MKTTVNISFVLLLMLCTGSCVSPPQDADVEGNFTQDRNYQYFPNMYVSEAYEAYGQYEIFVNEQEAKLPVKGTIPRGWMPYPYPDTPEGYQTAKQELKNPLPYTEENAMKGEKLFNIYCAICHGEKGNGKGTLSKRGKILGVPAYNAPGRDITAGSAYHVMYYGRNLMGSYAVQTTEEERWQIAMYVMDLKRALNGLPKREYVELEEETEIPPIVYSEQQLQAIIDNREISKDSVQHKTLILPNIEDRAQEEKPQSR